MKKFGISFSLAALAALSLTITAACGAPGGPLISSLKFCEANEGTMALDSSVGHVIEFAHDSVVPVKVFIKEPEGDWVFVKKSDPTFEGHVVSFAVSPDIRHAWIKVASDYSEVLDKLSESEAVQITALPSCEPNMA